MLLFLFYASLDKVFNFLLLIICGNLSRAKYSKEPDLVFLDIELGGRNGFDLLREVRNIGCDNMDVIFYTAYDRYMINALRESALDFMVKPIRHEELKEAIERYKARNKKFLTSQSGDHSLSLPGGSDTVALSTNIGMKFIDRNKIVLFQCARKSLREKPVWEAMMSDFSFSTLSKGITARKILRFMGEDRFVAVNQSVIVNMNYLSFVEFKTRACILLPPFNKLKLTASRAQLAGLRGKFDLL